MWWCTLLAVAVISWTVAKFLSIPVPPGHKSPWKFRILIAVFNIFSIPTSVIEMLYGPVKATVFLRNLSPYLFPPGTDTAGCKRTDLQVDGVRVRLYEPEVKQDNSPAVIFFHGGGWALGSIALSDNTCQALSRHVDAVVVSVEYRLAPEHVFPAAFDDCYVVTRHFLTNARDYGIDPSRIALVGDSAGGGLVATVTLRLRDEKISPQPKLQVLIYPATQAIDFKSPSYMANRSNPILPKHRMVTFWLMYAFGHTDYLKTALANEHTSPEVKRKFSTTDLDHKFILNDHPDNTYRQPNLNVGDGKVWKEIESIFTNPYFAPLMAKDLSRLPEAIVITMHQDVLRDDGIWYARKLKDAGNDVTHVHYISGYHGMLSRVGEGENYIEISTIMYELIKDKLKVNELQ